MKMFVMFAVVIAALFLVVACSTTPETKPLIERIVKNSDVPEILYFDRRDRPEVRYYDVKADGGVDEVRIIETLPGGEERIVAIYLFAETQGKANDFTARTVRDKKLANTVAIYRFSEAGRELQEQYGQVRDEYKITHSEALPENQGKEKEFRDEKLKLFVDLLVEYHEEQAQAIRVKAKKAKEITQLRTFIAFEEMRKAYNLLSTWEQDAVFDSIFLIKPELLPRGLKVDGAQEILEIAGLSLLSRDPRYDFELFLTDSYTETDYMSAWSIRNSGEFDKVGEEYRKELEKKGLQVKDTP